MKIILAFDSFKGSLSAPDACAAAAAGLRRGVPDATLVECPLSDGGEGFADAMARSAGGRVQPLAVCGPLFESVQANLVFLEDGRTAVVECAQACGLHLVPADRRNPAATTTRGVGDMIATALACGARRIIVGLGGSATNDGGMGLLAGLGWTFQDADGHELDPVGGSLHRVAAVQRGPALPAGTEIIAACDVRNPLAGPTGAAFTYAAQKGATPAQIRALDAGLAHFAAVVTPVTGRSAAGLPGAGAAGGLGFALLACLDAEFESGAAIAMRMCGLEAQLAEADLCLTGEGCTDGQTAFGKLPAAVALRCVTHGVPCVCLSGGLGVGWEALLTHGFTAVFSISQRPQSLDQAIAGAAPALADAAENVARLFGAQHAADDR